MNRYVSAFALLAAGLFQTAQAADAPACDRACLKGFTDLYFDALERNDASKLPVAPKVKFTENGETLKLGEGFWKTADATAYRMEICDPERGDTAVQAVVREKDQLVMFMLRLKVAQQKITEIETIVARKGVASGPVWAAERLTATPVNFTSSIRPAEQNSRLELMAIADSYWRAFETNGTPDYHPAPFLPTTQRFENGLQTTNAKLTNFGPYTAAEQFDRGLFQGRRIYDRRYPVVDLERGVALSIVRFGRREGTATPNIAEGVSPLVAEFFAVKAGSIEEIQVVMTARPTTAPTGW